MMGNLERIVVAMAITAAVAFALAYKSEPEAMMADILSESKQLAEYAESCSEAIRHNAPPEGCTTFAQAIAGGAVQRIHHKTSALKAKYPAFQSDSAIAAWKNTDRVRRTLADIEAAHGGNWGN